MLDGFDPHTIHDEALRQVVLFLMNQVEELTATVRRQADEIQRLRDENNRLKGEQGKPHILPNQPTKPLSSEAERAVPTPRTKRSKLATIPIDRTEILRVDRTTLPPDAQFKGYQRVVVQDIRLTTDTVCFLKETFYSPSEHRTYLADVPSGFEGHVGPQVKALVLTLAFESGMSEPIIHTFLSLAGLDISAGQISTMLLQQHATFHAERTAILAAGLASSPWQHIDTTATRVNGVNQECHVLCNPLYTVYTTLPQRDRLHVLDGLRGGAPRQFRLDVTAERLTRLMDVPARDRKILATLPRDTMLDAAQIAAFLAGPGHRFKPVTRKRIMDALAIAAYHAQRAPPYPIVRVLIGDDAPQWAMLTEELALCWVHDARAYKKLTPQFPHHQTALDDFLTAYWTYYRELLAYRQAPSASEALRLRAEFTRLFATVTGYAALDARIALTAEKHTGLLLVLVHPEIPLHNNPAELGARRRVRKRDMRFGPRSDAGAQAWDTFQTLVATAKKLDVNVYAYFVARIRHDATVPRLADRIQERAVGRALGASWTPRPPRPDWKPVELSMWHG